MNDEAMTSQPGGVPPGTPPEWADWLDCLRMGRQLGLTDEVIRAELGITQATLARLQHQLTTQSNRAPSAGLARRLVPRPGAGSWVGRRACTRRCDRLWNCPR